MIRVVNAHWIHRSFVIYVYYQAQKTIRDLSRKSNGSSRPCRSIARSAHDDECYVSFALRHSYLRRKEDIQRPSRRSVRRVGGIRNGDRGFVDHGRLDQTSARSGACNRFYQGNATDHFYLDRVVIHGSDGVDFEVYEIEPIVINRGRPHIGELVAGSMYAVHLQEVEDIILYLCAPMRLD